MCEKRKIMLKRLNDPVQRRSTESQTLIYPVEIIYLFSFAIIVTAVDDSAVWNVAIK